MPHPGFLMVRVQQGHKGFEGSCVWLAERHQTRPTPQTYQHRQLPSLSAQFTLLTNTRPQVNYQFMLSQEVLFIINNMNTSHFFPCLITKTHFVLLPDTSWQHCYKMVCLENVNTLSRALPLLFKTLVEPTFYCSTQGHSWCACS